MNPKIWIILASVAVVAGLFFLGAAAKFIYGYHTQANGDAQMQGVVLALIAAFPCWLVASGLLWPVREVVPKAALLSVYVITLGLCALYAFVHLYIFVMWLLDR